MCLVIYVCLLLAVNGTRSGLVEGVVTVGDVNTLSVSAYLEAAYQQDALDQ